MTLKPELPGNINHKFRKSPVSVHTHFIFVFKVGYNFTENKGKFIPAPRQDVKTSQFINLPGFLLRTFTGSSQSLILEGLLSHCAGD